MFEITSSDVLNSIIFICETIIPVTTTALTLWYIFDNLTAKKVSVLDDDDSLKKDAEFQLFYKKLKDELKTQLKTQLKDEFLFELVEYNQLSRFTSSFQIKIRITHSIYEFEDLYLVILNANSNLNSKWFNTFKSNMETKGYRVGIINSLPLSF